MRSDLYPSPASIRYSTPAPPPPIQPPFVRPVVMGRQLAPPPKLKPKPKPEPVVQGDWWPCFVCGLDIVCQHRETDIIAWMAGRS
jgi:hypothetical protein